MYANTIATEILGFSQTYQWYTGQPFPISDPTFKPQKLFLAHYQGFSNCQARFGFGGDLTKWKYAGFVGYEGHVSHNLMNDREEINRLIFNVSGESRTVEEWQADIEAVVEILRQKYPNLQALFLQPVIGGLDDKSTIRAVKNHPYLVEAINAVVNQAAPGILRRGAVVKLGAEAFSDQIGHLTVTGAQESQELIFNFYNISA